jgi:bifunctional non-homologous end joining protein LigD
VADNLESYRAKRNFDRTTEPQGGDATGNVPRFVVQKHKARALHYDFRLEVDGVMPSWAVPKGPSYDPTVKRLAVHVEDHPLDYQDFEGMIPAGEYGGGRVIVWDRGTYRRLGDKPMREAIEAGHVSVWLDGSKLVGGWALTRTGRDRSGKEQWILVKRRDEKADPERDVTAEDTSVKSGRALEALSDSDATWTRGQATFVPPMLARLVDSVPPGDWILERKLDGLRCVAVRNGDEVSLWSRNHLSYTARFPLVVDGLRELPFDNFTLDGELVAMEGSRTSFSALQRAGEAVYVVFDVLHLLGSDTRPLPQSDRTRLIDDLVGTDGVVRRQAPLDGSAASLFDLACRSGWEGLVAKRSSASYASGRSGDWLKIKCDSRQELVIGGWTDPKGTRSHLGAVLVGYYDADGGLRYAGKVGSGFDQDTLVLLSSLLVEQAASPFVDAPRMKDAHWAEPTLVANVAFTEWTLDGRLRHPRFQGLRDDKSPSDVRREAP